MGMIQPKLIGPYALPGVESSRMGDDLTRRQLLAGGSAALVAALHAPSLMAPQKKVQPGPPLFRRIRLLAAADLGRMEEFYCGKLGLRRLSIDDDALSIQAGATELTFAKSATDRGGPLTHFAFNIPQNKIRPALDWLRKRSKVIPAWGDLADPAYPKEVVHFRHWNAHSLFFWDPAGNLLELIARHDLANDASGAFTSEHLLNVSELGLAVADPTKFAKFLHEKGGIPAYPRGTSPSFAMGDENGLLLCLQQGQKWWNSTDRQIQWNTYPTEAEISGLKRDLAVEGYPFKITGS